MKLIRNSVFETNSSSCHSISVGKTDVYDSISPDEDGKIILDSYEFDWGPETFSDVEARLAYVFIYIRDWAHSKQDHFKAMFDKVVQEHTGATEIVMQKNKKSWCTGYIDHKSAESGDLNHLFASEQTLKSFLFDSASLIETDNDNH